MLDHLRAMAVFAKVADAGSFRAAARHLGISPSVVSHHVTSLERHLDTPLIYRTTRKLSLTDAGRDLAVSARAMLDAAEEGFGRIGHESANPAGSLKITAPAILQHARFVTRVSTYMRHFPKVEVSVNFSDRRTNIVAEGFDLAFRVGKLEDSSLMSRKLADGRLHICAAPHYLQAREAVRVPEDLKQLEMINLMGVSPVLSLTREDSTGKTHTVQPPYRISVDSGFAARRMAEEGSGIVMLPDFFVRDAIAAGALADVLPGWEAPPYGIYAVWPANAGTNFIRTSFLNFVAAIARSDPETDRRMIGASAVAGAS